MCGVMEMGRDGERGDGAGGCMFDDKSGSSRHACALTPHPMGSALPENLTVPHPLMHSPTPSLAHSVTLTHPLTHSFTPSFPPSPTHPMGSA